MHCPTLASVTGSNWLARFLGQAGAELMRVGHDAAMLEMQPEMGELALRSTGG